MTRLLETGYMETDDPVVAACFLGGTEVMVEELEDIVVRRKLFGVAIISVRCDAVYPYPILIPADTVAEVCTDLEIRDFIRNRAKCETWEWMSWMDTHHTQEDK